MGRYSPVLCSEQCLRHNCLVKQNVTQIQLQGESIALELLGFWTLSIIQCSKT
jgi:hypothetical protein